MSRYIRNWLTYLWTVYHILCEIESDFCSSVVQKLHLCLQRKASQALRMPVDLGLAVLLLLPRASARRPSSPCIAVPIPGILVLRGFHRYFDL